MVVVDEALAPGLAANAAAVMAMTLGAKVPALVGDEFVDGAGERHPGLITTGLPVLRAAADELPRLRAKALEAEVGVIGFPALGPDDDRLRALPRDGRRDRRARLPRPRASTATARPCAASPAASACSVRCRGRSGSPTGSTRRSRRRPPGRSPRRPRSSGSATVSLADCLAFSAFSSAVSSSAPGPRELEREDRQRDRDHRQRRARAGRASPGRRTAA